LPQAQTASLDQTLSAGLGLKHPRRRKHLSYRRSVARSSNVEERSLQVMLLGDVNLLFLVHMPQEQQQSAGTKDNRQNHGNYAMRHPSASRGVELKEELKNRATQRGQAYN
jgi:hypothetical protein